MLERLRLLHGRSNGEGIKEEPDEKPVDTALATAMYKELDIPPLPPRFSNLGLPPTWFIDIVANQKKKRIHRKTHGLIPFKELAQIIADNYKSVDYETRSWCQEVASRLLAHNKAAEEQLVHTLTAKMVAAADSKQAAAAEAADASSNMINGDSNGASSGHHQYQHYQHQHHQQQRQTSPALHAQLRGIPDVTPASLDAGVSRLHRLHAAKLILENNTRGGGQFNNMMYHMDMANMMQQHGARSVPFQRRVNMMAAFRDFERRNNGMGGGSLGETPLGTPVGGERQSLGVAGGLNLPFQEPPTAVVPGMFGLSASGGIGMGGLMSGGDSMLMSRNQRVGVEKTKRPNTAVEASASSSKASKDKSNGLDLLSFSCSLPAAQSPNSASSGDERDNADSDNSAKMSTKKSKADRSATAKRPTDLIDGVMEPPYSKFPILLHQVIGDPTTNDCIRWDSCGKIFVISDKKKFCVRVLPKFDEVEYATFSQHLRRWNFARVTSGPNMAAYKREDFVKGDSKGAAELTIPVTLSEEAKKSSKKSKASPVAAPVPAPLSHPVSHQEGVTDVSQERRPLQAAAFNTAEFAAIAAMRNQSPMNSIFAGFPNRPPSDLLLMSALRSMPTSSALPYGQQSSSGGMMDSEERFRQLRSELYEQLLLGYRLGLDAANTSSRGGFHPPPMPPASLLSAMPPPPLLRAARGASADVDAYARNEFGLSYSEIASAWNEMDRQHLAGNNSNQSK